ncbi:MAG: hypothetical protein QM765_24880 [Myxococcales bacterium]
MDFANLFTGGSYNFKDQIPVFNFRVSDQAAALALFKGMYVELQVRNDSKGQLAYVLSVPDRALPPWAIPIDPDHRATLSQGAKEVDHVVTYVQCPGPKTIDLNEFAADVEHDWSGRYGRASDLLAAKKVDEAYAIAAELVDDCHDRLPVAHHLLGRCLRAQNHLPEAIGCYRTAVGMLKKKREKTFLPSAAGVLSDMGVAYKRSGDAARAACCLTWALSLRPNHPEALATFVTLFKECDALVVHACARMLALGRDKLAEQISTGYAAEYKKDGAKLLAIARHASKDLDLTKWPLALKKEELAPEKFLAALDAATGEPSAPVLEMPPEPPPEPVKTAEPVAEPAPQPAAPEAKVEASAAEVKPAAAPEPVKAVEAKEMPAAPQAPQAVEKEKKDDGKGKKKWWKVW